MPADPDALALADIRGGMAYVHEHGPKMYFDQKGDGPLYTPWPEDAREAFRRVLRLRGLYPAAWAALTEAERLDVMAYAGEV